MTAPLTTQAEANTRRWLERIVVGLNLCPFAASPFKRERIAYRVSEGTTLESVYRDVLAAADELLNGDPSEIETTLVIAPNALHTFDEYLDALALIEQALGQAGLDGILQIASFHPDYCFDGVAQDDPANHTNRSPHPTFHLIREAGLAAALESYPDAEGIPERNVELLRKLGIDEIRRLFESS